MIGKVLLWIHNNLDNILYPIYGAITTTSIGALLLQGLGAIVLAILGALGGWLANKFIIPKLNKYFKK